MAGAPELSLWFAHVSGSNCSFTVLALGPKGLLPKAVNT